MPIPSIFINYRREDTKWFAILLKEKIEAAFDQIRVFLDTEDIALGANWPDTLKKELQEASIVLSLVGVNWLFCQDAYGKRKLDKEEDWVRKEIEWALASGKTLLVILADINDKSKQPSEEAFKDIPNLKDILQKQHLEIRSGNFSSDFQPLKDKLAELLNRTPLDPISAAKRENILRDHPLSEAALREMPSRPLAPGSDPKWQYCPFVGLNYFTRNAARLYFGREKDLLELILMIQNRQHRLIFLHGYSGVGKSSLLSAGLIPRLEERWLPLYHRRDKAVGLGQGLRNLRKRTEEDARPALYILDQVEEMFTDLSLEDEQNIFLSELAEALQEEPSATFLLGFRSEYFSKVERLCWDISGVRDKEILPLSREEVIQAITGVWKDEELNDKYRLDIEEGLPEKIADHLSQHQIRDYIAPILQNRLERLWEEAFKGPGRKVKLTKDLYDELGDASEKELLISRLERIRQQANLDEEKTLTVLEKFVIDLPSAGAIKNGELDKTFADVIDYGDVLKELQKVDLLIKEEKSLDGGIIRLSHDLLAINVNWYDAIEYCNWLSEMKGLSQVYGIDKERIDVKNLNSIDEIKWRIIIESGNPGFRLPTEAEWEFAARGRGQRPGNQFAGSEDPFEVGWYKENSESQTHPVKGKKPNELGLYDMSGNVWEWCWDWYNLDHYKGKIEPIQDPEGPDSGGYRVLRGGSWDTEFYKGFCANRLYSRAPSYDNLAVGFRLARANSS